MDGKDKKVQGCKNKSLLSAFKSPVLKKETQTDNLKENSKDPIELLIEREQCLDEEIAHLEHEGYEDEELDIQIEKLHEYNEIKDAAQIVMGRLAVLNGVTVKEIHEFFGVNESD